MPEGPEIKRAADRIAKAIVNQPLTEVFFAFEGLKSYEAAFLESQVVSVQPRGKALLTRFTNQLSIYSHNQLYGVWYVKRAGNYPDTNRQLRLAIHTAKKSALLYSASDIYVLNDDEIAGHPFLKKLGPDLLDERTTFDEIYDRYTDAKFRRRGLGGLLLNQEFLCGPGNYLRSEILFVAGVWPWARPIDCTDQQLQQLAEASLAVTRQSYQTNGITNSLDIANDLKAKGETRRMYRHWVFSRWGKGCYRCGDVIRKETIANRRLYYCPTCQPDLSVT
ncbi:endonuclease VIII [filamentous cyanobacterium LEGE 11480]|uniref:DNA-(apurinic or apyrimidinic site) lyase n=1 Tax=Romeriopsis navalis LEGE 11480 TaxID=2777977 RepID=A0A928Z5Z0_9CYAN|nr:endonuclease VIII [Romeriopsis navalis]MBE9032028.1 endonuclease VIII [Romeriopsis navalis LEGE 11480]